MSYAREPLRRVVVAGAGPVGVLAAIGLKRAQPRCEVIVLGLRPDRAAFADYASTALPFTNHLHERLGITEDRIVRGAGGSHRIVIRYQGWGGMGHQATMPYGADVDPASRTAFARDWGGGPRNAAGDRPAGTLAEVLAEEGRFAVPPDAVAGPLGEVEYCMRWNPAAYLDLLIGEAQQLGVAHLPGDIVGFEPDGTGGIASLAVAGADAIAADLYLDCSGPKARLSSALGTTRAHDWWRNLPVRELVVARPGNPRIAVEDCVTLLPEGWRSELAGRDGLHVTLGLAPNATQDAALRALAAEPLVTLPVVPGRADECWRGNVIALGDAFARFEPLGNLNLDLAHRQLDLLLEMLPGRTIEPLERAEFNRRAALMADAVRDTLGAHYASRGASRVFPGLQRSQELDRALDQFERRGRMPFREEAPLLGAEFQAMLSVLGFAAGVSPQSRAGEIGDQRTAMAARLHGLRTLAAQVPRYDAWLASEFTGGPEPRG